MKGKNTNRALVVVECYRRANLQHTGTTAKFVVYCPGRMLRRGLLVLRVLKNYFDLDTQERLFEAIDATETERQETIACDDEQNGARFPINSLGMEVSKKILLMSLPLGDLKVIPIMEKGLWIIYNCAESKEVAGGNRIRLLFAPSEQTGGCRPSGKMLLTSIPVYAVTRRGYANAA